ncbi:hypothetical protein O181_125889 [Austropuccinia psidii MF-1]|uniref:Uncharacterized protein n=1 Tax=Austropuccinia psidii MF-1 TaxID=1389203 RepID=A0A9Q3Q5P2_9BASI|nr:hypothetical protein [Austropuccinia psidii MF-1]
MPFGIMNAPAHFQRMMDTIFQEEILEGWMVVYHQGESRVNRRRLTSRQANVKQDKSRAHVKRTSSTRHTLVLHQIL